MSVFNLMGDDPMAIERRGDLAASALREVVARERGNSDVGRSSSQR